MELLALALLGQTAIFLGVLLIVLWRTEKFLRASMVYMKAKDIHDVLAADSLLEDKPRDPHEIDENEVVVGQDRNILSDMRTVQNKHRERYLGKVAAA